MNNGNGRMFQVVMYLVGVLVTVFLVIGFPTLTRYVIANDKETRARETALEIRLAQRIERNQEKIQENQEKVNIKLNEIQSGNIDILVAIAELKKDVEKIQ